MSSFGALHYICITLHYKHFIRFSELVWGCLQFEMPRDRLPGLRKEFANERKISKSECFMISHHMIFMLHDHYQQGFTIVSD